MNNSVPQQALWLTLAQAFLPPTPAEVVYAVRYGLADNLDEMANDADLDLADHVTALRDALQRFQDDASLLIHYCRLFLLPPFRAHLNLSVYLDGTVKGAALDAIEYLQEAHGIAQLDTFHTLPDHLTSLLGSLVVLCDLPEAEADRAQLVHRYLLPGLSRLCQAISSGSDIDSPYLHLARVTDAALRQTTPMDESIQDGRHEKRRQARRDQDKKVWRNCACCSKPYAREKELRIMVKALQAQNLPFEHLGLCPDCRNPSQDWFEKRRG